MKLIEIAILKSFSYYKTYLREKKSLLIPTNKTLTDLGKH